MKYLYWVFAGLLVVGGIYLSMSVSVAPESVSKIAFGQFTYPEDLGNEVYEKLKEEIKESPLVMLGVTPNQIEDVELWRGFLETAGKDPATKYDVIIVEPKLPYVELLPSNLRIELKEEMSRFVDGVKKARTEGLRVAVVVPSIYSSQVIKGNPVDRLKTEFGMNFTSLSVTKFPVTDEQEKVFEPLCAVEDRQDKEGTGALGCMIRQAAKKTRKGKFAPNKFSGLMEQSSPRDYLILLNRN
jgi:hypothetical protein